jgi:serine/threonine protein kinase
MNVNEELVKMFFKQIAEGLHHCHSNKIIHRDIKLNNILLDEGFTVKICDFGISKIVKKGEILKEQCGTPAYMSPEMILHQGYRGFSCDIWSLGILLYFLFIGTFPFLAKNR